MFADRKRGKAYASKRKQRGDALSSTTVHKKSKRASAHKYISPASAAYLQAFGSPFTPISELAIDPRIPDTEFSGQSVVAHTDNDFNVMIPTSTYTGTTPTLGRCAFITSTEPFGLGGVDVLETSKYAPPSTIFPVQIGGLQDKPRDSGANAAAGVGVMKSTAGIHYFATWVNSVVTPLLTRQLASYRDWEQYETVTDLARMIGNGIKLHDLGPVETQSGQLVANHMKKEFWQQVVQHLCGELGETNSTNNENCRLWVCFGPLALTSRGDVNVVRFNEDAINGIAAGLVGEIGQTTNPHFLSPFDSGYAQESAQQTTNFNKMVDEVKQLTIENSVLSKDEGEEFLISDGVSLRGYHKGSDRPFHETKPPAVLIGDTLVSANNTGDVIARSGLRKEGLSVEEIKDWLATYSNVFSGYSGDLSGGQHPVNCIDYTTVNRALSTPVQAGWTSPTYQVATADTLPGAFDATVINRNPSSEVDWLIMRVLWRTQSDVNPYDIGYQTGANAPVNAGVVSFHLCDSYGVPIAMRYERKYQDKYAPSGDGPYMSMLVESVSPQRPMKIYRAAYSENQISGHFLVPTRKSVVDIDFDNVALVGAEFPEITKGFTFFKSLGDGLKKAFNVIWEHRAAISAAGTIIASLL